MRKGIIYFFSILFGIIVGSLSGGLMAYHHPMKNIEGSWSSTDFLKTNEKTKNMTMKELEDIHREMCSICNTK